MDPQRELFTWTIIVLCISSTINAQSPPTPLFIWQPYSGTLNHTSLENTIELEFTPIPLPSSSSWFLKVFPERQFNISDCVKTFNSTTLMLSFDILSCFPSANPVESHTISIESNTDFQTGTGMIYQFTRGSRTKRSVIPANNVVHSRMTVIAVDTIPTPKMQIIDASGNLTNDLKLGDNVTLSITIDRRYLNAYVEWCDALTPRNTAEPWIRVYQDCEDLGLGIFYEDWTFTSPSDTEPGKLTTHIKMFAPHGARSLNLRCSIHVCSTAVCQIRNPCRKIILMSQSEDFFDEDENESERFGDHSDSEEQMTISTIG